MIGDKGFMRPELQDELQANGLYLQTPLRENMKDNRPKEFLNWMKSTRRLIETVINWLQDFILRRFALVIYGMKLLGFGENC